MCFSLGRNLHARDLLETRAELIQGAVPVSMLLFRTFPDPAICKVNNHTLLENVHHFWSVLTCYTRTLGYIKNGSPMHG